MTKQEKLKTALQALSDLSGPFMGVNPYRVWTGITTILALIKNQPIWLDWEGNSWRDIYHKNSNEVLCAHLSDHSHPLRLPQILEFDNTETAHTLEQFHLSIATENQLYKVDPCYTDATNEIVKFYKELKRAFRKVDFYNSDQCVRLHSVDGGKRIFECQRVSYYDYLRTNLAMDYDDSSLNSLRVRLHGGGTVGSLKDSVLADPLGINILIFSSGGELILQKRSLKVLIRPKELCSSASGTVEFRDICNDTFDKIDFTREVREEVTAKVEKSIKGRLQFLGLTRELIRGGMPELFFFAVSELPIEEIRKSIQNKSSKESIEVERWHYFNFSPYHSNRLCNDVEKERFKHSFNEMLVKIGTAGAISIPLMTNLILWYRYKNSGN